MDAGKQIDSTMSSTTQLSTTSEACNRIETFVTHNQNEDHFCDSFRRNPFLKEPPLQMARKIAAICVAAENCDCCACFPSVSSNVVTVEHPSQWMLKDFEEMPISMNKLALS